VRFLFGVPRRAFPQLTSPKYYPSRYNLNLCHTYSLAGSHGNNGCNGLFSGIIAGGATSASSALTAALLAPDKFNITNGHFYALLGITFMVNGLVAAFLYLKQSPLPALVTTTTTESIGVPGQPPALISKKVEQVQVSENPPKEKP
jgi:hypothetical protein